MEPVVSSYALSSDGLYAEFELDRPTLVLVLDSLQHFADHYDDRGFIDKTATLDDIFSEMEDKGLEPRMHVRVP